MKKLLLMIFVAALASCTKPEPVEEEIIYAGRTCGEIEQVLSTGGHIYFIINDVRVMVTDKMIFEYRVGDQFCY